MNRKNFKTSFGEDTNALIAAGFTKKKINQNDKKYCINCYREMYASNYTGTNLCSECKNKYYDEKGNYKK